MEKTHFGPNLESMGPRSYFFLKNLVSSVTRIHGQLSSCTISQKTNDPILRKCSDGQTDRQTEESDLIEHCLTNVKHPIVQCNSDLSNSMTCFFSGIIFHFGPVERQLHSSAHSCKQTHKKF